MVFFAEDLCLFLDCIVENECITRVYRQKGVLIFTKKILFSVSDMIYIMLEALIPKLIFKSIVLTPILKFVDIIFDGN